MPGLHLSKRQAQRRSSFRTFSDACQTIPTSGSTSNTDQQEVGADLSAVLVVAAATRATRLGTEAGLGR